MPVAILDLPTFLRSFQMRKSQIMWFLGAGASRASGIKTAGDMIWEFKQKLYCSEKKLPLSSVPDVGDPAVRRKLQSHFGAKGGFPPAEGEDEYAFYFEKTYPSAKDRRAYIESQTRDGKPSFGHLGLAMLMKKGLCRATWGTNFDRTVEDAAAKVFDGTGSLVVADLSEPAKVRTAFAENRWPVYAKLHGDFQSERLKNTSAELQQQDAEMRACLVSACKAQGLAVVGYSGRDSSVLDALTEAIDSGRGFPGGLFWFKRYQDDLFSGVGGLLTAASDAGIDAKVVEVETFDELIADILRFLPETEQDALTISNVHSPRLSQSPLRAATSNIPAIRTNALAIISHPATCRLVVCEIGGWAEIEKAIATADVDIEAHRTSAGVLAFGRDVDIRRAFESHGITAFETHAIAPAQLRAATGTRTLIQNAMCRALARRPLINVQRDRNRMFLTPNSDVRPEVFSTGDFKPVGAIRGRVPKTGIEWVEICSFRLDFRLDRLWLLLEPKVNLIAPEDCPDAEFEIAREFRRERRAGRRNKENNALLNGWIKLIVGDDASVRLRAFEIGDGYDADFEISKISGFSGFAK
jgi:SIR2-like domain